MFRVRFRRSVYAVNPHILQIPAPFLLTDQFLIRLSRQVVQSRETGQTNLWNLQAG